MEEDQIMDLVRCAWCGLPATHFCSACGKWICDAFLCKAKSTALALGIRVA
jgi:hypothetical protein